MNQTDYLVCYTSQNFPIRELVLNSVSLESQVSLAITNKTDIFETLLGFLPYKQQQSHIFCCLLFVLSTKLSNLLPTLFFKLTNSKRLKAYHCNLKTSQNERQKKLTRLSLAGGR